VRKCGIVQVWFVRIKIVGNGYGGNCDKMFRVKYCHFVARSISDTYYTLVKVLLIDTRINIRQQKKMSNI